MNIKVPYVVALSLPLSLVLSDAHDLAASTTVTKRESGSERERGLEGGRKKRQTIE